MKYAIVVPALLPSAFFPVNAQLGRGTILGTVSDCSGAVISGATLTVRDIDTNATLIPAQRADFKKENHAGIVLQVDEKAAIDIQLLQRQVFGGLNARKFAATCAQSA